MSINVSALFVDVERGPYEILGCDCWGEERDARTYPGSWPVIAHPPCQRWGNYWSGGPSAPVRRKLGDDDGCFAAALAAVRQWGGILEHPAKSRAWRHFGLMAPGPEGWTVADEYGWTCQVEQGHFGHFARKSSWLYAVRCALPSLPWGPSDAVGVVEHMDKKKRHLTPRPFAELLLDMALTVHHPLTAAWRPCLCCDEFLCSIHGCHVFECDCPPIEDWTFDPYAFGAPIDAAGMVAP